MCNLGAAHRSSASTLAGRRCGKCGPSWARDVGAGQIRAHDQTVPTPDTGVRQMRRRGEMSSGARDGGGCANCGGAALTIAMTGSQFRAGACDQGIASTVSDHLMAERKAGPPVREASSSQTCALLSFDGCSVRRACLCASWASCGAWTRAWVASGETGGALCSP